MYRTFYNDFFNMMFEDSGWYRHSHRRSTVYVVSENKMKELEHEKKERTLKAIDIQIEELQAHRKSVAASIPSLEHSKE